MPRNLVRSILPVVLFLLMGGCPQSDTSGDGVTTGDAALESPETSDEGSSGTQPQSEVPASDGVDSGTPDATDSDFDGTPDAEDPYPLDPFDNDFDADGIGDDVDNCFLFNPDQEDANANGIGDLCEAAILLAGTSGPSSVVGTVLVAYDGQFLGYVDANAFNGNSLANSFGTYGNPFSSLSIWNEFGTYGSSFSSLSPWNSFTSTPPILIEDGQPVAYVTTNAFLSPRIHPNDLALAVGRTDVLR